MIWRIPPRWLRRLVLDPLVVALAVAVVVTLPVWLVVAAAASPLAAGRLRPLRLLWLVVVYLALEAYALVAMLVLWVGSGFGWKVRSPAYQRAHYRLAGTYLRVLFHQARWVLRLRVVVAGTDGAAPDRPLLVFCRHAGPGDSFILTHALINWYAREPRIVLKDTLQWDPAVDVVLNRLPNRFIAPGREGDDIVSQIGVLATGLDHNDVFVIFPEGGNFTPTRWTRAISRLRQRGFESLADRAERMPNVLAPHSGGVLAALDAAPDADVDFVAHTGLEHLATVGDVWRELPMDKEITMRWWRVPAHEVPKDEKERVDWLYEWWAHIDEWIGQHRPIPLEPRQPPWLQRR